jgi:ribosomal protein S11
MKTFIVNSELMASGMDPMACATGTPKMLQKAGIKGVKVKVCYCCGPEGKPVFEFEAPSREALSDALEKIKLPFASIMEATKVMPEK